MTTCPATMSISPLKTSMALAEAVLVSEQAEDVSVLLMEMPKVPVVREGAIGDWSVTL